VLADDADAVLDALGAYAARRRGVHERLPEGAPTDSAAAGEAREVLLSACREYGLVGDPARVTERVDALHEAGADTVVGYPARGLDGR